MNKDIKKNIYIFGSKLNIGNKESVCYQILQLSKSNKRHGYVCFCNTHSLIESVDNKKFQNALNQSFLTVPDGAPVAYTASKKIGFKQSRVAGPDTMLEICEKAQDEGLSIFLFGSSDNNLLALERKLKTLFPNLYIAGKYSPDFSNEIPDSEKHALMINQSNANITFVSLGCPKQELWCYQNYQKINSVLLGVGAAFNFHSGMLKRAPELIQRIGLEWAFRMFQDPIRLIPRYFYTNIRFIILLISSYGKKG